MVKRCVGIDIGSTYISAIQMVRSAELIVVEKTFKTQMRRRTDSPVLHLKQLFSKYGFDPHAKIAISMPDDKVFFHKLESGRREQDNREQQTLAGSDEMNYSAAQTADKSALEQDFPVPADQLVLQFTPDRKNAVSRHAVLAATTKTSIHEMLDMAAEASVYPDMVEAAVFAAYSSVNFNYPEIANETCIIARIDETGLAMAVIQNGSIVLVRNLPLMSKESDLKMNTDRLADILRQEAEATWQLLYGAGIEKKTRIFLVPSGGVNAGLGQALEQKRNCGVVIADPCIIVKSSDDCEIDSGLCTAEGLALGLLEPQQAGSFNFLRSSVFDDDPVPAIKKDLVICAALVAGIIVFLILGMYARLFYLEKEYSSVRADMKEVFKKTLPDEKTVVDPLIQLEQKLVSLRDDYKKFDPSLAGAAKPLEILRSISLTAPSQSNITVNNILLTDKSVRLSGSSASFKSVYDWQSRLKANPKFSAVDILNIDGASSAVSRQEDAGIKFIILISLDDSERI